MNGRDLSIVWAGVADFGTVSQLLVSGGAIFTPLKNTGE